MKILVISDTHGKNENYLKLIEKIKPIDMLLHCGDIEGAELLVSSTCECPVHMVMGNNDFFSELPKEEEFEIGDRKVLITHGHYYYVSMSAETLKVEARARGLQVALFGHTHRPYLDISDDLVVMNPGSLSYPRQDGKRPTFGLIETDEENKAHYSIHFLDEFLEE